MTFTLRIAALAVLLSLNYLVIAKSLTAEDAIPKAPTLTLGKPFACADYGGNMIHLVDAKGKSIWSHKAQRPQDVWVLNNGNILYSHVKGAVEITRDKKVVWEYTVAPKSEVHACQPLPDGLVMVAESGPARLLEIDREGKINKEIPLQIACKKTHGQMRVARKTKAGTYTVGQYSDSMVREYDGDGKVISEFPLKQAFSGIRLPSGNTLCAMGDQHRIVELDSKGKVVWEVTENDLPGNPLRFVAGLQRLPNGNTLICNWGGHGHIGKQPQIVEITPEKKVAGVIFDNKQFKTISGVFLMGLEANPADFEVTR